MLIPSSPRARHAKKGISSMPQQGRDLRDGLGSGGLEVLGDLGLQV